MLVPQNRWFLLLVFQMLHLRHHRLAKRHISFAWVISAAVLCVPPTIALPAWLLTGAHLSLCAVQLVGSLFIQKLSPDWERESGGR